MKLTTLAAICAALVGIGCNPPPPQPTATKTSEGDASTAQAGVNAAQNRSALVRFVNAEPTIDKAEITFGDQKAFSEVAYRGVTPYQELPSDRREFRLSGAGAANALASNVEGLTAGRHYTLVAMRGPDNRALLSAFSEPMKPPAAGKANVRIINAATNEGDLALYNTGANDRIFDGVKFGDGTSFKEIDAGPAVLELRSHNRKTAGKRVQNRTLEAGKFYTLIALGDGNQETIFIQDELR